MLNHWFGPSCHAERRQSHGKWWLETRKLETFQGCNPCIAICLLEVSAVCSCLSDNVRMPLKPWTKLHPDRPCLITYRVTQPPTLLLLLHVLQLTALQISKKGSGLKYNGVKKNSALILFHAKYLYINEWIIHSTGIKGGLILMFRLSFYFFYLN